MTIRVVLGRASRTFRMCRARSCRLSIAERRKPRVTLHWEPRDQWSGGPDSQQVQQGAGSSPHRLGLHEGLLVVGLWQWGSRPFTGAGLKMSAPWAQKGWANSPQHPPPPYYNTKTGSYPQMAVTVPQPWRACMGGLRRSCPACSTHAPLSPLTSLLIFPTLLSVVGMAECDQRQELAGPRASSDTGRKPERFPDSRCGPRPGPPQGLLSHSHSVSCGCCHLL